jgi:hypothetical protein
MWVNIPTGYDIHYELILKLKGGFPECIADTRERLSPVTST